MAFRYVPSEIAKSAEEAELYILSETGGGVVPTGFTQSISNGYQVEVWSADGQSAPMPTAARGRLCLKVISETDDTVVVQEAGGYEHTISRIQSIYLPTFHDETIRLRAGVIVSCERVPGTTDLFRAFLIEDDLLRERAEFDGAPNEAIGWCPGIATGNRFTKE